MPVLARLVSIHGAPAFMRSDNGPEFVSNAILKWIVAEGIGSALSDPGKPWQNGADESFNGKFRDALAHVAARKGDHARYIGVRKNLFDLRRTAVIQNLEAAQRLARAA